MLLEVMGSQQDVPVKVGDVVVGLQETKVQEKRDRVGKAGIQAAPQHQQQGWQEQRGVPPDSES